jgi:hypothetical protein
MKDRRDALGYFGPKRFIRTLSVRITLSKALSAQRFAPAPTEGAEPNDDLTGRSTRPPFFLVRNIAIAELTNRESISTLFRIEKDSNSQAKPWYDWAWPTPTADR